MTGNLDQGKYCFDANCFIETWDITYKPAIFQSLWSEIASKKNQISLIKPIFDEIDPVSNRTEEELKKHPLRAWLVEQEFSNISIVEVEGDALKLEKKFETTDTGKGASKNDIMLIAYAKKNKKTVVTLEAKQAQAPTKKSNYKIPLICEEEEVNCIDFVEFLEEVKISI